MMTDTKRHEYWLVPNPMFAISHVVKATPLKRLARNLGLGYQDVLCTAIADSENTAAQSFQELGYKLGFYSKHRPLSTPEDDRGESTNQEAYSEPHVAPKVTHLKLV